jgi:hypothetical protein
MELAMASCGGWLHQVSAGNCAKFFRDNTSKSICKDSRWLTGMYWNLVYLFPEMYQDG